MQFGTAEHAASITEGRHPGIRDGLQWLTYGHLPEKLQAFSAPFYEAAVSLLARVATDSPELMTAINRLTEAKDSAVRAGIRDVTGRAGSIPRPQEVVEPPNLESIPAGFTCDYDGPHFPHDWLNRASGQHYHCPGVENVS